ncbi:MAG TPA: hypothetical protein VGT99_02610 [Gammaproteobacteria bacterium]|nr:hypothetical protein [Gammaproteobacteria bacterium]
MTRNPAVIIAGYGQMGHAMEALLTGRASLHIWPIAPDNLELPTVIRSAATQAALLLVCTPTVAHAAVLEPLAPLFTADAAVLSIAKGLDDGGRTAAGILHAYRDAHPWGVLGGPMIANEIATGRMGFAELGTADGGLFAWARELFPAERLRLSHTSNPQSVSWCGVLKNIYAPLIGVADGLGWGDNVRGHLIMAATAEMQRLLPMLAGEGGGAHGDAGLADFVTTITSASSHHYALGRRIAGGDYRALECEGVHSLQVIQASGRVDERRYPLYAVAVQLAREPARLAGALHDWLTAYTAS